MIQSLILIAVCVYMGWRYSKEPADMDWAYLHMDGMVGSWWGRDIVDVKSPLVHLINWCFVKIGRKHIPTIKWIEYVFYALPGLVYFWTQHNFFNALAFTYLINTGFLWAFHGNVSQFPASMIMMSFALPEYGWVFWSLAVLYEVKLFPVYFVYAFLMGWYWQFAGLVIFTILGVYALYKLKPIWFGWLKEAMWDMSRKMQKYRKGLYDQWCPYWHTTAAVCCAPWMLSAVWFNPNIFFWLTPIVYLFVIATGRVIRGNHLIVLVPFIAVSNIDPLLILMFLAVDFYAAGFYLRDLWFRFYPYFSASITEAMWAGNFIKGKPGKLWVSGMHSEVYIYADKPVMFRDACMQIEIRENISIDRQRKISHNWMADAPEWVVETEYPNIVKFNSQGYVLEMTGEKTKVWHRAR